MPLYRTPLSFEGRSRSGDRVVERVTPEAARACHVRRLLAKQDPVTPAASGGSSSNIVGQAPARHPRSGSR